MVKRCSVPAHPFLRGINSVAAIARRSRHVPRHPSLIRPSAEGGHGFSTSYAGRSQKKPLAASKIASSSAFDLLPRRRRVPDRRVGALLQHHGGSGWVPKRLPSAGRSRWEDNSFPHETVRRMRPSRCSHGPLSMTVSQFLGCVAFTAVAPLCAPPHQRQSLRCQSMVQSARLPPIMCTAGWRSRARKVRNSSC
jgi:hypothetical protein